MIKKFKLLMTILGTTIMFLANNAFAANLTDLVVAPVSTIPGVSTDHTISFRTSNAIPAGGIIMITYPAGFDINRVALAPSYPSIFGTPAINSYLNTVVITMGPDSNVNASELLSFQLINITNPQNSGNYTVSIETRNARSQTIDGPTTSSSFTIGQVQTLDHFRVVSNVNNPIVGSDVQLTITAQDAMNATVTAYSGSPVLSGLAISPSNTLPYYGPVNFVNGVADVIVRGYSAQANQSITITDGSIVGNSGIINFNAGPINSINIPFLDQTFNAGQTFQFTATCYDAYLNVRANDPLTWTNTTNTGLFNNNSAGNYPISASSGLINSNIINVIVSHSVTVDYLTISPTDIHLSSADQSQNYTVTAFDQYQNSWDVTNQATFTTTDPKGSFTINTYNAGKVGNWMIQASYGDKSISTSIIIDFPGKADKIEFVNLPDVINTNDIIQFYTKVFDKDGNELSSPTTVWTITEGINNSVIDTNGRFLSNLAGTYKIKNQFENASTILTISIADKIILTSSATVSIVPVQETIAKIEKSDENVIEQNVKPAEITKTDIINNSSENLIDTTTEENSINTIADDNEQSTISDETGQIKSAETEANTNNNSKFVLILTLIVAAVILGFAYWGYSVWGTENTATNVNDDKNIALSKNEFKSTDKIDNLTKNNKSDDSRW